ncbi:MAG: putative CopG family antitoxin [Bacteroidia bacterium]|jgi:predicted CopG family antitoxin
MESIEYFLRIRMGGNYRLLKLKKEPNSISEMISELAHEQSTLIENIKHGNEISKLGLMKFNKDLEGLITIDKYLEFKVCIDKVQEEVKTIGLTQALMVFFDENGKKSIIDALSSKKRMARKGLKLLLE